MKKEPTNRNKPFQSFIAIPSFQTRLNSDNEAKKAKAGKGKNIVPMVGTSKYTVVKKETQRKQIVPMATKRKNRVIVVGTEENSIENLAKFQEDMIEDFWNGKEK